MKKQIVNALFKKGDVVNVYSLQSFHHGGFLNGEEGIVCQDQLAGGSVMVTVKRNFNGVIKVDPAYEVYPEQLRKVEYIEEKDDTLIQFDELLDRLKFKGKKWK